MTHAEKIAEARKWANDPAMGLTPERRAEALRDLQDAEDDLRANHMLGDEYDDGESQVQQMPRWATDDAFESII